ncbi:unnamed protein product [Brassicogethes aeneus]|uniref:Elongation of very long chain fatty acids protein n=1 Tax=Brassicogethes aeneus TaxID=1431903 RepID=A0A9P0B0M5_BRAAE|nr:unnamed protein product [Brassicogethes aeneus]
MVLLLKKMYQWYFKVFKEYADPRADEYYLMAYSYGIFQMLFISLGYLYLIDYLKKFMHNRPPYNLKSAILLYNGLQVCFNGYITYHAFFESLNLSLYCSPINYSTEPRHLFVLKIAYFYFLTKILDTLDTIFFILRKKDSHVSFLHIYHHFGMINITWIGVKFLGGGHSIFLGLINSFVHTCMYTYYFLSALDDKYKNISFKKTITQIQLIQHTLLILIYGFLLFTDCSYPKFASFFFVPQCCFMVALFGEFYYRTYIKGANREKNN